MNINRTYEWKKTHRFRSDYVLTRDGAPVANVSFHGICSSNVRVTGDGIDWTIKRSGVMHPIVTLRRAESDMSVAEARARLGGSYDVVVGEFAMRFKSVNTWKAQFGWIAADGTPMIVYSPHTWHGSPYAITISGAPPIADESLLNVLLIFGRVLMAMTQSDTAAAITSTIVAVAAAA